MSTPFDSQVPLPGYADTPNEDPLSNGGRWTQLATLPQWLYRVTGEIQPTPSGSFTAGESLWNPETWTDSSVCWRCSNLQFGGPIAAKLRASADGASGYYKGEFKIVSGTLTWTVYKRVGGGSETVLASDVTSVPTVQTNDRFGFSVIGTEIIVWHQARVDPATPSPINAGWTPVITVTDTALPGPGYMTLVVGGLGSGFFAPYGGPLFPTGGNGDVAPGTPVMDINVRVA